MVQIMARAQEFGLSSTDYRAAELSAEAARVSRPGTGDADRLRFARDLDREARHLVHDLRLGRVDPRAAGFELPQAREPFDVGAAVGRLAHAPDLAVAIAAVEPPFYHYALLQTALRRYRHLSEDVSLTRLPRLAKRSVKPGEAYTGAPALRRLLFELGDLPQAGGDSPILDPALVEGLQRFQRRHGLTADGSLGQKTWAALTTPLSQRVRQIELTLERWRWLPLFKTPPIIVNIPQFRLFAFHTLADRAADITQMDVIVGQTYRDKRTPVFVGELRYVVFRPYWDVPRGIVRKEMLEPIRRNPDYLKRNNLELVDGPGDASPVRPVNAQTLAALEAGQLRVRQRPGADNALGLVKFIFPNAHNVFMHSTPAHQLFAQTRRAFSHGCIRVSDPVKLAQFVLPAAGPGWDRERIVAAMQGADNVRIPLKSAVPVMILYGTVLATEGGPILFFEDLYGLDRQLEHLLQTATRTSPPTAALGYDPPQHVKAAAK
ncbi:MAG: L,D-transpeptidase family protein [Steroidobacteraceae bacterium]